MNPGNAEANGLPNDSFASRTIYPQTDLQLRAATLHFRSGACCSPAKIDAQPSHAIRPQKNANHELILRALTPGSQTITSRAWPKASHVGCLMPPLFRAAQVASPVAYGGGVQTCSHRRKAPGRSHQPCGGYRGTPSPSRTKVSGGDAGAQYFFGRHQLARKPLQRPAKPDRRRACRHCPSGKSDFPVWPRQRKYSCFRMPQISFWKSPSRSSRGGPFIRFSIKKANRPCTIQIRLA
jgi:hypothetical protein